MVVRRGCRFCQGKTEPDYKNADVLKGYLSERARIVGSDRSGICARHQRKLSVAIKRARHLALLPYVAKV